MPDEKKPTIDDLKARGFEIEYLSNFPDALTELAGVLSGATIPIEEIIAGGGEAKRTQRLRRALTELKWPWRLRHSRSGDRRRRSRDRP